MDIWDLCRNKDQSPVWNLLKFHQVSLNTQVLNQFWKWTEIFDVFAASNVFKFIIQKTNSAKAVLPKFSIINQFLYVKKNFYRLIRYSWLWENFGRNAV